MKYVKYAFWAGLGIWILSDLDALGKWLTQPTPFWLFLTFSQVDVYRQERSEEEIKSLKEKIEELKSED